MTDLYKVLGLPHSADNAKVKLAFRHLAKKCHPDLHRGDGCAEQRFKEINLAYEILRSPEKRASYDQARAEARLAARNRFKSAVATMSASFAITVSSGLLASVWLFRDGLL